jgi:diaminopimelate epimerase
MKIPFMKMSGSGNDFILMDDREDILPVRDIKTFVKKVCERKVSVGADGLIIIKKSDKADFRWLFFNADGSEAEMCGNGGRCAARYAFIRGIAGARLSFETIAGIIDAEVKGDIVKLRLTDPKDLRTDYDISMDGKSVGLNSVNTGVPHVVVIAGDIEKVDVFNLGRTIRYHEAYSPAGTNANFIQVVDRKTIKVRTYERGVEDETLACGTGAVASALVSSAKGMVESPVNVRVKSGETLKIYFERNQKGFGKVYLEGSAKVVYQGTLWEEAYT